MMKFRIVIIAVVSILMWSCRSVPLTGRQQLSLVDESEVIALSLTQYGDFIKTKQFSSSKSESDRVRRIGTNISRAVTRYLQVSGQADYLKDYKWEFVLVQDPVVNAFCMPGGKVVIYTGILPLVKDDGALATVIGHEIAHAVARHSSERMSQQMVAQGLGTALTLSMAQQPQQTRELAMLAFGVGSQVGVLLPFSRKHEYEADELGLKFMAMAGYDPRTSLTFWQKMAEQGGNKPPEFLSTHPVDEKRIERIKSILPAAMKYYNPGK